ncbi:MAG TPA: hypothetical protein VLG38_02190 [Gammaproteobacteria bacterium]|nr:hypothetical protein [Gammaproteobacteria bacterium]
MDKESFEQLITSLRDHNIHELLLSGNGPENYYMDAEQLQEFCDLVGGLNVLENLWIEDFQLGHQVNPANSSLELDPEGRSIYIVMLMLHNLSNLKSLVLNNNWFNDEDLEVICSALLHKDNLERLVLARCVGGVKSNAMIAKLIANAPALKHLVIDIDSSAENYMLIFDALSKNKTLVEFTAERHLPSDVLSGLAKNIHNTALEKLELEVVLDENALKNLATLINSGKLSALKIKFVDRFTKDGGALTQTQIDEQIAPLIAALARRDSLSFNLDISGLGPKWTTQDLWNKALQSKKEASKQEGRNEKNDEQNIETKTDSDEDEDEDEDEDKKHGM